MLQIAMLPLPAGPRQPSWWQLLRWVRQPIAFLRECERHFGDTFTVRFPRMPPLVFMSHPDAVKDVFIGDPLKLSAGEANFVLKPLVGENSLLILDGQKHLGERRLMLPAFHGERMQNYGTVMREVTRQRIAAWPRGRVFAAHAETQAITLDIILRTVFGADEESELAGLRNDIVALLDILRNPMWLMPWFQRDLGRLTPWARAVRLKASIDAAFFRLIAKRREEADSERKDILTLLLAARYEDGTPMSDLSLRDEMMTLLVAGHETTATSLSWAINHILATPRVLVRLRTELAAASGDFSATKLPYLEAIIKETLRLTPVIPLVGRLLAEPTAFGAEKLPAGAVATPAIYLAHLRRESWDQPEEFKPERFLDAKISPYQFFPFGGGARRCIGAAFAQYEMRVVLAELFGTDEKMRLQPGYRAKIVRRAITFAPSRGVPIVLGE